MVMNRIFSVGHWLTTLAILLVGGVFTWFAANNGSMVWTIVLSACTLVGIVAVREQALVLRHENQDPES